MKIASFRQRYTMFFFDLVIAHTLLANKYEILNKVSVISLQRRIDIYKGDAQRFIRKLPAFLKYSTKAIMSSALNFILSHRTSGGRTKSWN